VTHEFLHLDGKIYKTLKVLLTKPGELTRELVAGRRSKYIGPLRLYLTASLLFFFLITVLPGGRESMLNVTVSKETRSGWNFKVGAVKGEPVASAPLSPEAERQREAVAERYVHNLPRAIFILMPVAALLTLAFYRRQQPYYVAHLYYSVHLHAFVFFIGAVNVLLSRAGPVGDVMALALALWVLAYHFIAQRRFFGEPWPRTLWKATAILVLYLVLMVGAMAGLVMLSLMGGGA
jgi:hypothetical protein